MSQALKITHFNVANFRRGKEKTEVRKLSFLIAGTMLAATSPLRAEKWVFVSDSSEFMHGATGKGEIFYDAQSVQKHGQDVAFTLRINTAADATVRWKTARLSWEIDCVNRTVQLLKFAYYNPNGSLLLSSDTPGSKEPIKDQAVGEYYRAKFCPN